MNNLVNFSFESSNVRAMMDHTDVVWIPLVDVMSVIKSSTRPADAIASVTEVFGDGVVNDYPIVDKLGRTQEATIVTEYAATYLIARSNTETGKRLNRFIHQEVLPQIRRTGKYAPTPKQLYLEKLDETTSKINELAAIDSKTLLKAARTAKQAGVSVEFLAAEIKDKIEPVSTWALSKLYGVTETRMNQLLSFAGLQNNIFELTDKGREFGRVLFDGNTAAITLWLPETIDYVRSQA